MDKNNFNTFAQGLQRYLDAEIISGLQKIRIGIAGAGGLGSNCAMMLVRSGFCRFKIIDFDVVEPSNLNRQFYFSRQVGLTKVDALAANLREINPDVEIETLPIKFTPENAAEIFADADVIVEAFDNPAYKKLLIETYLESGKLLTAVSGMAGWGESDKIVTRQIKDNFFLIGDLTTGISPQHPPMAPKATLAAAKQADIILSHTLSRLTKGKARD